MILMDVADVDAAHTIVGGDAMHRFDVFQSGGVVNGGVVAAKVQVEEKI